jgi:tetratricopeptide (TPR) repeat protein
VLADAGHALLTARQYPAAKTLLEQAAASDPTAGLELDLSVAAFHNSGASEGLRLIGNVPESRRTADYYRALAQMLDASGKAKEAIAALDQAIHSTPGRPDLYWQSAVLHSKNGHTTEALRVLDEAERQLPHDPQLSLLRATLLEASGRTEDAERLLDIVQRRWPEGAAVWVARGIIQAAHQHFEEARRALQTAVSLGARSPEAWFCLADATVRSAPDRIGDAEGAIGEALKGAPDDPWIQMLAGEIASKKGDYRTAVVREQNAIRLRPESIQAHEDLAAFYAALGRKQEAQTHREAAEAIRKKSSEKQDEAPDPRRLFQTRPPQEW